MPLLVAYGPHEFACAMEIEDGKMHGALSYFLLEALKQGSCMRRKHSDIHRQVCAMFRASGAKQSPVFHGNKGQTLFDPPSLVPTDDAAAVAVISSQDRILRIQAGRAHGVEVGDQFAIDPGDVAEGDCPGRLVATVCRRDGGRLVSSAGAYS